MFTQISITRGLHTGQISWQVPTWDWNLGMLIMIREESQDREKMVSLDLNLMRREIIEEAVEREKTQGTGM